MEEKLYLPNSSGCFCCGEDNPRGLGIKFYVHDGKVKVDVTLTQNYSSYKDVTHGGVISALLDETMGWAVFIFSESTSFYFTRELSVTYKRNVPYDVPLLVSTEFINIERNLGYARGKLTDVTGKIVYATSKGTFFPITEEKMNETRTYLIFKDNLKYHPKAIKYCTVNGTLPNK